MLVVRLGVLSLAIAVALLCLALAPSGVVGQSTPPACNNQGLPKPCVFTPPVDAGNALAPLRTVEPKPQDPQLAQGGPFIESQEDLLELGKAFFWDTQVGSDGQSCASCHFIAGADNRTRNAISPGLNVRPTSDSSFEFGGFTAPNATIVAGDFPSHLLADRANRGSTVLRDSNDTVGSQGVFDRNFVAVPRFEPLFQRGIATPDICTSVSDPDNFKVHGVNVRRVEPRNTPTVINAAFQNRQFWDGRAVEVFNGVDPFGGSNTAVRVYRSDPLGLSIDPVAVRIGFASTASQSVGPPLNGNEMSCSGRTFPDLGHKLLQLDPLGQQVVDPTDSVLGHLSNNQFHTGATGLDANYAEMIAYAFKPDWWNAVVAVTIDGRQYSQMEANFSMYWGLSVKAYLESLVADATPVDRFLEGRGTLSPSASRGLNIFQSFEGVAPDPTDPTGTRTINVQLSNGHQADARCGTCHGGAETTSASINNVHAQRLERMMLRSGRCAIYDQGSINTGVRRSSDDPGLNNTDPFGNSFAEVVNAKGGILNRLIPGAPQATAPFGLNGTADPAISGPALGGTTNCESNNIEATFKVPQLRNVELTGPYFHNGGQLTLMQVVDFYNRGGDFNNANVDDNIHSLGLAEQDERDLVSFLLALTDERVAYERAPFDHPSLCVPNGEVGDQNHVKVAPPLPGGGAPIALDRQLCIKEVGAAGRLTRLPTFLHADQFSH